MLFFGTNSFIFYFLRHYFWGIYSTVQTLVYILTAGCINIKSIRRALPEIYAVRKSKSVAFFVVNPDCCHIRNLVVGGHF